MGAETHDEAGDSRSQARRDLAALAEYLRELRDAAGMTQRELSQRSHVSDSSLSRYFAGQSLPPWEVVATLCDLGGGDLVRCRELWDAEVKARQKSRWMRDSSVPTQRVSPAGPVIHVSPAASSPSAPTMIGLVDEAPRRKGFVPLRGFAAAAVAVPLMVGLGMVLYPDRGPTGPREPSRPGDAGPSPAADKPAGLPMPNSVVALVNDEPDDDLLPYVVDVENWGTAAGSRVHLWTWRDDWDYRNQLWVAEQPQPDRWRFRNALSGLCLDRGPGNESALFQNPCDDQPDQQWIMAAGRQLRNAADQRCLDLHSRERREGADLRMADCRGGWYQQWSLRLRKPKVGPVTAPPRPNALAER